MADPDLSSLSVEQLLAMKQQASPAVAAASPTASLESLSTEELLAMRNSSVNQDWNLVDSIKNFGSGLVEGVTGFAGMALDVNPMTGFRVRYRPDTGLGMSTPLDFEHTKQIAGAVEPLLAEEDPQYRYARTIGNFAAPVPIKGANTIKGLLTSVIAGLGAQGAEDLTGDKKIAPLIGAVGAGGAASAITDLGSLAKRLLIGASADEITGSAAKAFRETTGLTADQLAAANMGPRNLLDDLQTTAERTGNAGVAQLEKKLAEVGENADIYAKLDKGRIKAREQLITDASAVRAINDEGLGASLIGAAEDVRGRMQRNAGAFWDDVPRDVPVDIGPELDQLATMLGARQGGLPMGSRARTLVEQFLDSPVQNSGRLQDIRADALALRRMENLAPLEDRALAALEGGIDAAMNRGLSGVDYDVWRAARQATAAEKGSFARGTAGGYLVSDNARVSNVLKKVFKGDRQAVEELRTAIGQNEGLMEQVKRGVLDMIPRDAKGQLTPAKMKGFLEANESGLQSLLGNDHARSLRRIYEDLVSQDGVKDLANLASKGGSATAQKQTVAGAIQEAITDSLVPGSGGIWGKLADAVKRGAGIRDSKAVEDLMFKAALDPTFAETLSKAPTRERILNGFETLRAMAENSALSGLAAGSRELSREQDNRTPLARLLAATAARPGAIAPSPSEGTGRSPQQTAGQPQSPQLIPGQSASLAGGPAIQNSVDLASVDANPISLSNQPDDMATIEDGQLPRLIQAVIGIESSGNPNAVSKKGAQGLMQVMPSTARDIAQELGVDNYDLKDPETNKLFGTYYLKKMLDMFDGDVELALTAYNQGFGRVKKLLDKTGGTSLSDIIDHLGPDGRAYARKVLKRFNEQVEA